MFFSEEVKVRLFKKLDILYGDQATTLLNNIEDLFEEFTDVNAIQRVNGFNSPATKEKFTRRDIILNTYADSIQDPSFTPLDCLKTFSKKYLQPIIGGCHILPFYEWDTDRGFSVLNYYTVDSRNGTWEQFSDLKNVFDVLMVDCVLNHASINNPIIQGALIGTEEFQDFALIFDEKSRPSEEEQLKITRARPYPVLTQFFVVNDGKKLYATFDKPLTNEIVKTGWVWTTFSRPENPDGSVGTRQVDLNFQNPKVLFEIIKLIIFYISKGATWIRLDAIGYLWKKLGTNCLHLPETHLVIEVLIEIFNLLDPIKPVLISEVNEPQDRALQYLGTEDVPKSDLIYLFTHFPLAVHAVLTGSAKFYNEWLPSLKEAKGRLFVSVLGTHDGMGMKPIGEWLPEPEKHKLQTILLEKHGALANYAKLAGGDEIVYELCLTPWNFINPENSSEEFEVQLRRYLVVFTLGLMIKGVPSIYINGLLGITNNKNPLDENRTINRQILNLKDLDSSLKDKRSHMFNVMDEILKLISIRKNESAFDVNGPYEVIPVNDSIVSVVLFSSSARSKLIALVNVSETNHNIGIDHSQFKFKADFLTDLVSRKTYAIPPKEDLLEITLSAYQVCWLRE